MRNSQKIGYPYMRIIVFLAAVLGFIAIICTEAWAAQVTASVANVRMQSESTGEIVGTLPQGTTVTILQWSGEWAQIQSNGMQGWMHQSVLSAQPDDYVQVNEDAVNLRSGPGTSYDLVDSAVRGEQLILLDGSTEWYHVQTLDGTVAYILGSLTTGNSSASASPASNESASNTYVEITGTTVNLREGPGTEYASLGTVSQGEKFVYLSQVGDWYAAQTNQGEQVYIYTGLSRITTDSTETSSDQTTTNEQTAGDSTALPTTSVSELSAPSVYLNGVLLSFDDVEPMIIDDRTMVPMRAIFEAMGAEVSWVEATQTVVGVGKDQTMVVLPIGSNQATVNDTTVTLDVPAQIVEDRTLAPLRFVGEALGATVAWDPVTRRIDITQSLPVEETPEIPSDQEQPVTPQEPEQPVDQPGDSETSSEEITQEPLDINRSYLHIGTEKNEIGLSVKLSGMEQLNPQASKEGDVMTLEFEGRYIREAVHLTQALGGGDLQIDAENTENGVTVRVTMPESVECQFATSDDGREMSLIIENRIRSVGRKVYGESDEMITIATVVPVQYQYSVDGRTMTLILSNTSIGIAEEKYSYYGSVMDIMTVTQVEGENGPEVHLVLQANQDCKFNTLLGEDGVLNIAVTSLTEDEFSSRSDRLVMIDAGHGGTEKGALYGGVDEREINLAIALKLGAYLQSQGIEVLYTRTGDQTVGLSERAQMANQERVAMFVSVHCNAATSASANGTETYFYAPIETPELFSQRMERQQLADCIQRNVIAWNGLYDRGTKEKNLAVLRETRMPSALVECGFLSNDAERAKLLDEDFQQRLATGIGNGIIEYLNMNLKDLTINPVYS